MKELSRYAPLLVPIFVSIFMSIALKFSEKQAQTLKQKEHVTICMPGYFKWVGLVGVMFFLSCFILMVLFPNDTATLWVKIPFWIFIFMGLSIIIIGTVWKIHFYRSDDFFTVRTFFGRTYNVPYSSIKYYKQYYQTIVLKTEKKRFYVDIIALNSKTLVRQFRLHKVHRKP